MPAFRGGVITNSKVSPLIGNQTWLNLAGKTFPHHMVTHKTQLTVAVSTETLQSEATTGQHSPQTRGFVIQDLQNQWFWHLRLFHPITESELVCGL